MFQLTLDMFFLNMGIGSLCKESEKYFEWTQKKWNIFREPLNSLIEKMIEKCKMASVSNITSRESEY